MRPRPGPVALRPPQPTIERAAYTRYVVGRWHEWTWQVPHLLDIRSDAADEVALQASFDELFDPKSLGNFLHRVSRRMNKRATNYVQRVVRLPPRAVVPVDGMIDQFVADNVALVKGLAQEHAQDLIKALRQAHATGLRNEQIATQIQERLSVGKSRAVLIARDQTGKFYGQLQAAHQQAAGVTEFTWSDSGDKDVRKSHHAINGRVFSYADPPIVDGEAALPGQPIQCRCSAIPHIPELGD